MTGPRKPASFRIEPERAPAVEPPTQRRPRALDKSQVVVTPAEIDVFDTPTDDVPAPPVAPRRRFRAGAILASAVGVLVSLAFGLWMDQLIRELFARAEWLGWMAAGLAVIAALALVVVLGREALAIARLASVEKLRAQALEAISRDDPKIARRLVGELTTFLAAKPETAAGRRALKELEGDIVDGADLVRIAEVELMTPLDKRAQKLILDAAKRVSVVTAVSPRALVDLAYVLFEAGRLIRRLSELYGGRPGTLGFFRLARGVLAHLAVTGAIAAGDDFVHQIVGQGLAAKLSAKLGEGVVNGMMTARIGVAAMEVTRPLPFTALKRPGMSDFLAALASFTRREAGREDG
ncbi:MAG: TIGR01620 family protein [Mesorhizobium sp.]|nr:TIGR01620 family protein [Mesorhizobium sp.]MBL8578849.1 TIGR01620 family protein [Mesorhizobium sp.]